MKRVLLVAAALVLLAPAGARCQDAVAPNIGHHLAPLEFRDLAGISHRLDWSTPEARTYLISFFEPRCADCFRELVFLDSVGRLARGRSLEVIVVEGSGQEPRAVGEVLSRYTGVFQQPAFTVAPDPEYALGKALNVQRMPSTFLVETHGVVLSRKEGFDNLHAIDLVRKTERLLGAKEGTLSPALVALGITGQDEQAFEKALEARRRARDSGAAYASPLAAGARVAPFAYTVLAGGGGTWRPAGEGRATVVFFWGALCLPCIREMAYLEQLRGAAGEVLEVIAVEGTGLPPERVAQVMERYRKFYPAPSYRVAADPERRLGRLFGVGAALPQSFVIGGDGTVLHQTDEFVQGGERALDEKIERALGLAAGALTAGVARGAASPASSPAEESPTVLKALAGRREEFAACLTQAETLCRNWQYSVAVPLFRRCLELDPSSVAVHGRLAEIYERQGEAALALEQLEQVLRLEPGNAEAARQAERLRPR